MKRTEIVCVVALGCAGIVGCQEDIASSGAQDLIPVEAVTVEVTLPFEEFARDLEAWGGYGQPYELSRDIVAKAFAGTLDSRVLNSWGPYPRTASVRDSAGIIRIDTLLTVVGGTIVARFDTLTSTTSGPTTLAVGALQRDWDFRSAGWFVAVDSVGDQQSWDEPGADPVTPMATGIWDPAEGDSVVIEVDSAAAALLVDSAGAKRGFRLDALTDGVRLDLTSLAYSVSARSSIDPDTLLRLSVSPATRTFIYRPEPGVPESGIRVGGAPAWRSVFTVDLPQTLDGPPSLCAQVTCPVTLTPESLISASMVLTTRAPDPAFQPTDSVRLDVRPVLEPSRLPKSPLGSSIVGLTGVLVGPEDFGVGAGTEIEIPLGLYIEVLLENESQEEPDASPTLALLSSFEPLSLYFATFEGPDSPAGPRLRLILTFADEVGIR